MGGALSPRNSEFLPGTSVHGLQSGVGKNHGYARIGRNIDERPFLGRGCFDMERGTAVLGMGFFQCRPDRVVEARTRKSLTVSTTTISKNHRAFSG